MKREFSRIETTKRQTKLDEVTTKKYFVDFKDGLKERCVFEIEERRINGFLTTKRFYIYHYKEMSGYHFWDSTTFVYIHIGRYTGQRCYSYESFQN